MPNCDLLMMGTVEKITIDSRALQGNPLGDPAERSVFIYLPPGYAENTTKRFPAILMLSSHGNTAQSLLNWRAYDESIDQQLDRLIGSGECPPHIMIMPDTWTRLGGASHLNSPALCNYADFLFNEVVPYVDTHYRTLAHGA